VPTIAVAVVTRNCKTLLKRSVDSNRMRSFAGKTLARQTPVRLRRLRAMNQGRAGRLSLICTTGWICPFASLIGAFGAVAR
jgi:hypothetical protein